jgi:hypothetical protein
VVVAHGHVDVRSMYVQAGMHKLLSFALKGLYINMLDTGERSQRVKHTRCLRPSSPCLQVCRLQLLDSGECLENGAVHDSVLVYPPGQGVHPPAKCMIKMVGGVILIIVRDSVRVRVHVWEGQSLGARHL